MSFVATFLLIIFVGFGAVEKGAEVVTLGDEVTPIISEVLQNEPSITPTPTLEIPVDSCNNTCKDCMYFAVNKENSLSSSYTPAVESLNLAGGGYLIPEAKAQLENMFTDATSQNISLKIVSSFRSYQTQAELFESYVQREFSRNGGDREKAITTANIYSAKPGHSEHQLGTTVDLSCPGCTPFISDTANNKVYEYLRANSYKFGFVISFTEQNKHITNYKAEPWHIRYLGKEYAAEYVSLYNQLDGNYSIDKYLEGKCF